MAPEVRPWVLGAAEVNRRPSHGRDYQPRHSCKRERGRPLLGPARGRPAFSAHPARRRWRARPTRREPACGSVTAWGGAAGDQAVWPCSDFLWQGKGSWPFWAGRRAAHASRWLAQSGRRPRLPRGRRCPRVRTDLSLPRRKLGRLSFPSALPSPLPSCRLLCVVMVSRTSSRRLEGKGPEETGSRLRLGGPVGVAA